MTLLHHWFIPFSSKTRLFQTSWGSWDSAGGCTVGGLSYGAVVLCLVAHSCLTLCDPMDYSLPGSTVCGIFQARTLKWVPCASPVDLPNSGTEPMSPILWANSLPTKPPGQLKNTGVGRVAYPFSRGSSQPRNQPGVSCIAGGFFTS